MYRQINDNDYIYVSSFDVKQKVGRDFTLEHFENDKMTYKISANTIKYDEKDSIYKLINYTKRRIGEGDDILEISRRKDTIFSFDLEIQCNHHLLHH